jgi:hypothetical protein
MLVTSESNASGAAKRLSAFQVWFGLTFERGRAVGMLIVLSMDPFSSSLP